jgi:hypothetical protein
MALDNGIQTYAGTVSYNTTTSVRFILGTNGTVTNAAPFAFGSTDEVDFMCVLPIAGFSSNVQVSSDTDTRIVDFVGTKGSTQALTANSTDVTFTSVKDSHGAWGGSIYTVPVSGDYLIQSSLINNAAAAVRWSVYINGTIVRTLFDSDAAQNLIGASTILSNLVAGQTISIRCGSSITASAQGTLSIMRLSGPSVVAASETVAASYQLTAATTLPTATAVLIYSTKIYDTHSFYNNTTGVGTIPVSGKYRFSVQMVNNSSSINHIRISILKNGTLNKGSSIARTAAPAASDLTCILTAAIDFIAGDTFQVNGWSDTSTQSLTTTAGYNFLTIERVGN